MIRVKICLKIWCKMNLKAKIILPKDYDHMPSHWQQPSLAPAPTSSRRTRPQPNTPLQWQPLTSPSPLGTPSSMTNPCQLKEPLIHVAMCGSELAYWF